MTVSNHYCSKPSLKERSSKYEKVCWTGETDVYYIDNELTKKGKREKEILFSSLFSCEGEILEEKICALFNSIAKLLHFLCVNAV